LSVEDFKSNFAIKEQVTSVFLRRVKTSGTLMKYTCIHGLT